MAWIILVIAGLLESLGVMMMNRYAQKRDIMSIIFFACFFTMSLLMLSYAFNYIPMGTGYAVWTGIGVVGGTLIGMFFYNESKDIKRVILITIVLASAIGLNIVS